MAVQNIPLNIQKRNEQSINEGSWLFKYSLEHAEREGAFYKKGQARLFCAFCENYFFKILGFRTVLWPPGEVLVVLQYSEECSSAFLTQKNFEKQYYVGPTYTNFFRNRASVRRFSSNFFLEALEGFFKIFKDQGGRDIGPASPLVKFWQDLSTYEFYKFGTDMTRGRG